MRNAIWRKCSGEAHGNAYIDNCWTCAPYWEIFPACPDCGAMLRGPKHGQTKTPKARCTNSACASVRRWFSLANEPTKRGPLVWLGCTFVEIGVRMIHGMTSEDCDAGF